MEVLLDDICRRRSLITGELSKIADADGGSCGGGSLTGSGSGVGGGCCGCCECRCPSGFELGDTRGA